MKEEIKLTSEELEIIKDETRWRERVILQLKALNGTPKRVTVLEVSQMFQWAFIGCIILGALSRLVWVALAG